MGIMASSPGKALLVSTLGCVDVLDVIRQAQVDCGHLSEPSAPHMFSHMCDSWYLSMLTRMVCPDRSPNPQTPSWYTFPQRFSASCMISHFFTPTGYLWGWALPH